MEQQAEMTGRLTQKVIIVTGAASGIGAATVQTCVREGAHVLATDIQDAKGEALAVESGVTYLHQDVTDETRWVQIMDETVSRFGRLDGLVNNAGMFGGAPIEDSDLDTWNHILAVNLTSVMLGAREAIRVMKANPGGPKGSIVNISSITGFIGLSSSAAYTASKGGVRLLSKSIAVHCARQYRDIRCNSVHPGAIDTPMNQAAFEASGEPETMRAFFSTLQPVGRLGLSEEVAEAVVHLASDEASFTTGTELVVDGGWLAAAGPL